MLRDLLARIGTDRALTPRELGDEPTPVLSAAWDCYRDHFDSFTGSRIDPQFARLDHPARFSALPAVSPDTTIVIAGAGPSLAARAQELTRLRKRLSIWTSIRGAEALSAFGLSPDLVIVQHPSDLDAYLTVRHLRDRNHADLVGSTPVVLAEPRTPAPVLAGGNPDRLATFDPALGWGLWPASLAWMACGAKARAITLVGIDLGTLAAIEPAHRPLAALLALIASGSPVATIDAGDGAAKPGWVKQVLDATVGSGGSSTVNLARTAWSSADERHHSLAMALAALRDHTESAEMFRARALECRRSGDRGHDGPLAEALAIMTGWGESAVIRAALQEELGATFLPRFWRHLHRSIPGPMWRPVMLAADEVVRQAKSAAARIAVARTVAS